jgi:hypothetical protein
VPRPPTPEPAAPASQPFNRRLLAQGRSLPPAGPRRVVHRGHLRRQDLLGAAIAALALYAVVYGVRLVFANGPRGLARGDFLTPAYVTAAIAAVAAACSWFARRRASAS